MPGTYFCSATRSGKSLTDLLNSRKVPVKIDPKYPQATGIESILSQTSIFGNYAREILINPFDSSPFFTSDFPIAIEATADPCVFNKIVPLSPNIAIRIRPDRSPIQPRPDFSFPKFRHIIIKLSRTEVVILNRLIVRCAESIVFYRDNYEWIPGFVKKNAAFRVEIRTNSMPHGKGTLLFSTHEISEVSCEAK